MTGPLSQASRRLQVALHAIGEAIHATRIVEDTLNDILSEVSDVLSGVTVPPALWGAGQGAKESLEAASNRLIKLSGEVGQAIERINRSAP